MYARQVRHPSELLRGLHIVDTPGTNAVVQGHQQITESIVPRADLIVFVTSADRPFSDSERLFLSKIWNWRKKVVVVVNVGALRVRRTCSCARTSCVLYCLSVSAEVRHYSQPRGGRAGAVVCQVQRQ